MPKVSGSYQGVTMQPQFPNYQTAGMLRPAPPVTPPITQPPVTPTTGTTPTPPPVTPPPVVTPPVYPSIPVGPPAYPPPVPLEPGEVTPRDQLVNALIRNGSGGPASGGRGRTDV